MAKISIHEIDNPAVRLYKRAGFKLFGENTKDFIMLKDFAKRSVENE